MFAVEDVEVNAEGAFFGLEVDRVELLLQAVDHGDPSKWDRFVAHETSFCCRACSGVPICGQT